MLDEKHQKNIRIAIPGKDAEAIQAIYSPVVRDSPTSFEYDPPTIQEMEDRIANILVTLPWLVYERDGEVLGYAYASPHRVRKGYQWSVESGLYISPSAHRQGIGKALYEALFEILAKQGYYTVIGGVTLPNEASCQLHLATGFELIGIYKKVGNKFGKWWDAIWYQRELRPYEENPKLPTPFSEMKL